MQIHTEESDGTAHLSVVGDLDLATGEKLHRAGLRCLDEAAVTRLVLDLSAVTFIDSTGIGALVKINNAAHDRGASLKLLRPSRRVSEILHLTAMDQIFDVDDDQPT
ncbi:MAG: STAS domain-containing protein [Actinomycetota bacterium]|nr:STAS domain-containing protein [Actinomycetota bacterium]